MTNNKEHNWICGKCEQDNGKYGGEKIKEAYENIERWYA